MEYERYCLNILTVKATEDGYTESKDGSKEKIFTKGKIYKMYGTFFGECDYFEFPIGNAYSCSSNSLRYDVRLDDGGTTCLSKYLINFWKLEVINQEYKPWDSCFIRDKDIV